VSAVGGGRSTLRVSGKKKPQTRLSRGAFSSGSPLSSPFHMISDARIGLTSCLILPVANSPDNKTEMLKTQRRLEHQVRCFLYY